jgi:hypothetical protein
MERREILLDPCHLGLESAAAKTISEPMVHSTEIVHLCWVKISTISKQTKLSLEPRHLGVPSGVSKIIFWADGTFGVNGAPILHRHEHYLQTERIQIPRDTRHLGVPLGASKTISNPMVHSTQTMHYLRMDWAFTWASSPMSTIECVQNDFWADVMLSANCASILQRP